MKRLALFASVLLLSPFVHADGFGPSAWTQYRLNASHNAVFENGKATLPDGIFQTGAQVRANPVIIGNRLFVGNHLTGGMFGFDVVTGKLLWGDDRPWYRHAPNWIHTDMLYVHGRLFLGYGNRVFKSASVRGTGDSGVMAADPDTGKPLWHHRTNGEVMPTPAYWHGTLYAVTGGGYLLALDPANGKLRWRLKLPGWVSMSSPSVRDGMLYVGCLNAVVAVNLRRHAIQWAYRAHVSFTDVPPAVSESGILVITGVQSRAAAPAEVRHRHPRQRGFFHFIFAFDAHRGTLLWKHLLGTGPMQQNNTSGNPTIWHGRVFVGSPYTDSVFTYDLNTGKQLWDYPVGARVKGAPAIYDGIVFFGDTQGFLHALKARSGKALRDSDGRPIGKLKLGGSRTNARAVALAPSGPVVINQDVFVSSQDGRVYRVSIPHWLGQQPHRIRSDKP